MRSNYYFFHVAALFMNFLLLPTSGNAGGTKAAKMEDWPSAKNIPVEKDGTQERETSYNIPLLDNSTIDSKSDKGIQESINKSNVYITSTEQPTESDTILNPAFINCVHSSVGLGRFVRLSNGLVYVPEFKIYLNASNYIIKHGKLFYCTEFLYSDDDFAKNKVTEEMSSLESDYIDSRVELNHTVGRFRRARDYLLSDTTTEETSTITTDVPVLSSKFKNCIKTRLGRRKYEKLSNGSVFVPSYNKLFNNSDYALKWNVLIVCANSFPKNNITILEEGNTESTTNFSSDISDLCIPDSENDEGRIRRAVDYEFDLDDITTTVSSSETAIYYSILSPEFLNCFAHILVEPGCYEKLSNGSVYVPLYNKLFNSSDYVLRSNFLLVCPPRINTTTILEEGNTESTTKETSTIATDAPVLSSPFPNCNKAYFGRTKYEKLSNGSVYVPSYNKLFNSSDYLLKWNVLTVCKNLPRKNNITVLDEEKSEKATNFSSDISDRCNVTLQLKKDEGRFKRSLHYEFENMTTALPETIIDYSILSPDYKNCDTAYITLEPECYEKLPNGSVFAPGSNIVFDISNYIIRDKGLIICPSVIFKHHARKKFVKHHETEKFSTSVEIVSFACTIISTICILLHVITFALIKKMRNLPGYCLLSLCIALVNAYVCTFIQIHISDYTGCTLIGMCSVYFFLASFFWMNVMAYDVWKSIRLATSKLRLNIGRPMIQFAFFSLYAWGTPLLIILLSIVVHFSVPDDSKFRLKFNLENCWFTFKQALILYFAGPLFTLIGMNVLFFVSSFSMISKSPMRKSHAEGSQLSSDLRSRLVFSLKLSSVIGFMWIFGIIAAVAKSLWMWYLYSAFTALQGVFIFCSFSLNERIINVCLKALRERKCSASPTETSSQQTTTIVQKDENEQSV